ncbi:M28 family peptidase [bacterium]|nr:M28 family peptidase [bacterium]
MRKPVLLLLILLASCNDSAPAQAQHLPGAPSEPPSIEQPEPEYTAYFDAANAWRHLHKQVTFGPRVPGTPGHTACRRYLEQELLAVCDTVQKQEFSLKLGADTLNMTNLIGRFDEEAPRRIILAAHWDTRPTADNNPPGQRNQPISGANDGASGVAILLELARVFHEHPPPVGVDIVLFDGEDYGPGLEMMFLGSKHFAQRLGVSQVRSYNYGILLDMVGDSNLDIHPENNSEAVATLVYRVAYELSRELGYSAFKKSGAYTISDDHLPLIERGIKIYDFIDFNYPYWHTTKDTEDKCSSDSLEAVGRTVENMVYLFPDLYAPE